MCDVDVSIDIVCKVLVSDLDVESVYGEDRRSVYKRIHVLLEVDHNQHG